MAADTNGDGAQEIITGAATVGSDGTLQCQTGLGHGDALHVGRRLPSTDDRPTRRAERA
jgi:rhamnogalacturonan endolyase